jgi:tetratricopeptide (TPR) repeat protein
LKSKSNDEQKYNISAKRDLTAFKELQSFSVYVNLFSQTEINGMTRSVFKIIVEDNISHHKYIGYSLEKNKNNIDIFVNYVLSNLEMRGGLDKNYKLLTGRNLISHESEQPSDSGKIKKAKVIKDNLSHKDILGRIYKELIFNEGYAEIDGYTETKNPILPPLFVDSFIRDFDKITKLTDYWRNQKINENDNMILKDTLSEAAHEVEKYQDNFDFDKALKFYKRLNLAAVELADSEKLSAQFLLKQVKIYFHLEQYDMCRELIKANMLKIEQFKLKDELGEFYYYLGMMSYFHNKNNEADEYFSHSTRLLMKSHEPEKMFIYFNSRITRYIIKKDYGHAITLVNESIRNSFVNKDPKKTGYLYGIKSEIYFRDRKFTHAEEALNSQLDYACEAKDIILESKCLAQMFQILAYCGTTDEIKLLRHLSRIKKLSKTIKKNSYYYDSLISLGIFFYRKDRLGDAEKYFIKASKIYTADATDAASHIVNMIYLAKIRIAAKNYLSAVRLLNRMLKLCSNSNVNIYPAYIENLLGRIYSEKKLYAESNVHLKRTLKCICEDSLNDPILRSNTYKYIGSNYSQMSIKNLAVKNFNSALKILNKIKNDEKYDVTDVISDIKSKINGINL